MQNLESGHRKPNLWSPKYSVSFYLFRGSRSWDPVKTGSLFPTNVLL